MIHTVVKLFEFKFSNIDLFAQEFFLIFLGILRRVMKLLIYNRML